MINEDENTSPNFDECNRNLVEELCGASIEEITPFNIDKDNDQEYQYSIISPN